MQSTATSMGLQRPMRRAREALAALAACFLFGAAAPSALAQAPAAAPAASAASAAAPAVFANDKALTKQCLDCHGDATLKAADGHSVTLTAEAYGKGAHRKQNCADCHETAVDGRHIKEPKEPLGKVRPQVCQECHEDEFKVNATSVHGKKAAGANAVKDCVACHGDMHTIVKSDDPASPMSPANQIKTCGECHEDMMAHYGDSVHAKALLKSGLTQGAPSCTSCHGSHDVLAKDDPKSKTAPANVPETCGKCHTPMLADFQASPHGVALAQGKKDAPTCSSCHESHAVKSPTASSERLAAADRCGNCHEQSRTTFRDSFHGKAVSLQHGGSASCASCHTPHANFPASDKRSSVHPDNLAKTCGACHANVNAAFLTFDPHADPTDPNRNPYVHWIFVAMTGLLMGVFGFFGLHGLLWLQRALVGKLRGEFHFGHGGSGPYVRRFSGMQMSVHITIVVSFLLLAATGLPLKFANAPWAPTMIKLVGGAEMAGILHRLAGVVTFGYFAWHIAMLLWAMIVKRERGFFWGPRSMVPQGKDLRDFVGMMKYFFYMGPRPKFDRFTYWEKFDYLAVFWGVGAIGVSGLVLWFPTLATAVLPGWALNAAYVIHSDEALLATGFIFLFHFFHTHLRPEAFPMDPVIFTGSMPLDRFKEERPLEYERLVAEGKLEQYLVPAPTATRLRWAYVFGFTAVAIGIALAAFIFVALWSGALHM